jgi:hypothetical protein
LVQSKDKNITQLNQPTFHYVIWAIYFHSF